MIVYRFKFDDYTADSGLINEFLGYLSSCLESDDSINYMPSRRDVVIGCHTYNNKLASLTSWIKSHINYDFEYETHSDESRTLTQIKMMDGTPVISVCYLLPLFSVESYLNL